MAESSHMHVLAFAAHPDDVELCAGGTVCMLVDQGYRVGIVDLTRGELGSRGNAAIREKEACASAKILGVAGRENLGIPDGMIENSKENQEKVIRVLRRHRPTIVLVNAPECRHPDHAHAGDLVAEAAFYSGLSRIECRGEDAQLLEPWRPQHILHYMQSLPFEPSIVVDVSSVWDRRMKALAAFSSQFHSADYEATGNEPETFVSNPDFLRWIEARAITYGYRIGAKYGEPFLYRHGPIGTDDLVQMLRKDRPFR